MKKTLLILLIVFFTFSICLYAQGPRLNLTGTWKLDVSESQLPEMGGRFAQDQETTLIIEQERRTIRIETIRGEVKTAMELTIGGEEQKVESPMMGFARRAGMDIESTTIAKAERSEDRSSIIVTLNTTMSMQDRTFEIKTVSSYSLSEDGNTLTEKQTRSTSRGDSESVLVYNKSDSQEESQEETNFSGTWKLDLEKSQMPQMGDRAPQSRETTLTIEQKDNLIKTETVTITQRGERKSAMNLVIGGGETKVESMMGMMGRGGGAGGPAPVSLAKAESEDGTLIVTLNTTMSMQDRTFTIQTVSSYSLSEDGKTLTEKQIRIFGDRETESVLIYNKV